MNGATGFLLVFVGGGLGSMGRHGINLLAYRIAGGAYPYGTLCVNIVGALLMGVVVEVFALRLHLSQPLRLLLTTGILGGFTTFSSFALDAVALRERGEGLAAGLYVAASVGLGIGALYVGMALVRGLLKAA